MLLFYFIVMTPILNFSKDVLPSPGKRSETGIQENALSHPARGVQGFRVVLGRLKATGKLIISR